MTAFHAIQSLDSEFSLEGPDETTSKVKCADIKFAVSHSDEGCELTVFEDGRACTVTLTKAWADCLVELITGAR